MKEPPKLPPHVIAEDIVKLAVSKGYNIQELTLVYYVGMDEVCTTIRQSS